MVGIPLEAGFKSPDIGPAERIHEPEEDIPVVNLMTLDMKFEGDPANIRAWLQGYPANPEIAEETPNSVATHTEYPSDANDEEPNRFVVDEIYFPGSGALNVMRGGAEHRLNGDLPDISLLRDLNTVFSLTYDGEEAFLVIRNGDIEKRVPGFVIPGGVEHSTSQADPNTETWWIAIKITRENPHYEKGLVGE